MRIDKYLKTSRIIKRRTVANEACAAGRVTINDTVAKPGTEVKIGDIIKIRFGEKYFCCQVLSVDDRQQTRSENNMYKILETE